MKSQKDIFLSSESDNWFSRNRAALIEKKDFDDLNELLPLIKFGNRILEIGCSNGAKLNYLSSKFSNQELSFCGIDPSNKSIDDGKIRFKDLNLQVGTSDALNYPNDSFDIVIVGFCLYLVDRNLIFKTVAEIDRVLKTGGFLVITDFEPPFPLRKKYHHAEGVFSYKNNYSDFFTGGKHYTLIRKMIYSHSEFSFEKIFNERVSTSILYKEDPNQIYQLIE